MTFMLIKHVGDQADLAHAFNGLGNHPLVQGAAAAHAAGRDLTAVGHEPAHKAHVFIVNALFLDAKNAGLSFFPSKLLLFWFPGFSGHLFSPLKRYIVFFDWSAV